MSSVRRLPERIGGPNGVLLRSWEPADGEALLAAVSESAAHLRPWMEWMAEQPKSVEGQVELIEQWDREWAEGGDVLYGVFVDGQVAGGCGLHHRLGPDGLEIGYWIHAGFVRRGLASLASALVTDAAFELPWITRVQIRHDKANVRSGGVPRKLGFRLVNEVVDAVEAPGEMGVSCYWQVTREEWRERAPLAACVGLKDGSPR
jgi:RimJ/RimL family protein N-acetyltransferase